jgi:hypothetical protein
VPELQHSILHAGVPKFIKFNFTSMLGGGEAALENSISQAGIQEVVIPLADEDSFKSAATWKDHAWVTHTCKGTQEQDYTDTRKMAVKLMCFASS